VADVRGFVRINRGVLDDDLFARGLAVRMLRRGRPAAKPLGAIEEEVEVPVRRRLDARHPRHASQRRRELLRDDARRLPQAAREREGQRHRDIPQRPARRCFEGNVRKDGVVGREVVQALHGLGNSRAHLLLNRKNHNCSVIRSSDGFIVPALLPWRARSHAAC
jgi:hypothetical protein